MDFSETYKQAGPCAFSPNARYLAVAVDYRLVVRDVLSLKVHLRHFEFLDYVMLVENSLISVLICLVVLQIS